MSPNRKAALAAAEALGGLISWVAGNFFGLASGKCETWEGMAFYAILAVLAYALGLTLVTNGRVRRARFMGRIDRKLEGFKEAEAGMREFLTERAVFVVGQMPPRPGKPTEKAPN